MIYIIMWKFVFDIWKIVVMKIYKLEDNIHLAKYNFIIEILKLFLIM